MSKKSSDRHFPVRPNLDQLKHQAKDFLRAVRRGDAAAVAEMSKYRRGKTDEDEKPDDSKAEDVKLADAQYALARSYGISSWARLVTACRMTDAIWRGDVEAVRKLVQKNP